MKWQIATIILVISAILICGCTQQPTTVTPAPVTGTKAPATTAATIATVPKSTTSQPSVPIAQPSVPIAQEALSPFDQMTFDASGYYEEALQLAFESWNSSGNMDWVTSRTFLNQANDKLNLAKKTFEQASPVASTPEQKEYLSLKSQAIMNMAKSLETDGKVLEEMMKEEPDDDLIGKLSDESSNYYNTASNLYDQAEEKLFSELPPVTVPGELKAMVGVTQNATG